MEDAHIASIGFSPDCSIFGVFDGHGGKLIISYTKPKFF